MKRVLIFGIIIAVFVIGIVYFLASQPKKEQEGKAKKTTTEVLTMRISSPAFGNNQNIPEKYTCDGQDLSPPLKFDEIPKAAVSLVLIMDDPDAPAGTFVHWTVWNIPPTTTEIAENTVPAGAVLGMTDFGKSGYGGPCPPSGTHRYFFKLYALDTTLQLSSSAKKADIEAVMTEHILSQTELVGLYSRGR